MRLPPTPCLALLVCLCAAAAFAQEPTPTPPAFSTEILVTPERGEEERGRTPATSALLTDDEIDGLPAANLGELLAYLPGFHSVLGPAFAGRPVVTSRGFFGGGEAEYVQLLVDGVPVADVESGLVDWQGLAVSSLRRVEALRGPGSSLYGDTALGGVVQIFTAPPGERPGWLGASGGSFGSLDVDGGFERSLGGYRLGLDAGLMRTDGARSHSGFEQGRLHLYADRVGDAGVLRLDVSALHRDRDDPGPLLLDALESDPGASSPEYRFDAERRRAARGALSYRRRLDHGMVSARLHAGARDSRILRTLLLASGLPDSALRNLDTTGFGLRLDAERALALAGQTGPLRLGLDLGRERLDTDYAPVAADGAAGSIAARASARRVRLAAFASQSWDASARLRVVAGLRWDRIEDRQPEAANRSHQAWSPRLGVNLDLVQREQAAVSLYVQLSRAFKTPTLDQLFDPRPFPDFQGGTLQVSNPVLRPQRARNVEVGVSASSLRHRGQLVFYSMQVEDEIDFDIATFRYANIARSRHTGFELDARLFTTSALAPSLSYAWSRATPREAGARDLQLKNVPQHVVRPSLWVRLAPTLQLAVRYQLLAGRYLDDANRVPLDDASSLDVRIEGRHGRVRGWLDLLNLTNTTASAYGFTLPDFSGDDVPYAYPMPGFALRAGFEVTF